ncbi:MAG: tetratricopeptide repeat protein [Betaproteobacteria bacterium]|nr:tetratricopeptide repeat protein [Betaproteobacteria bacterium]
MSFPFRLRFAAAAAFTAAIAASPAALAQPAPPAPPASVPAPASTDDLPTGLSAELFYRLLLGDIALQRGDAALAARAYLEVAQELKDVRLARRAAEIAYATRQRATAEAAATLWLELAPDAERPQQILAALAGGGPAAREGEGGAPAEADLKARLEKLLADQALSGTGVADAFLQLNRAFSRQGDKAAVYAMIRDLAAPYASSPEAHFAVSLAALNAVGTDPAMVAIALERVDRALALKPDWDRAALLKSEILAKRSTDEAVAYLSAFLKTQPDSRPIRGALAQHYVEQKRLAEARTIFEALAAEEPDVREYAMGVAILSYQLKDWPAAEAQFAKLAANGDDGTAQLYLAQIAEETKRYEMAITRYKAVTDGDRAWLAKLRVAAVLGKLNRIDEGRRWLADLPAVTIDQRIQVRQAEASLLREAGDSAGAYAVLEQGLAEFPDAPDLLYDVAMLAEKLDRLDVAEARLKRLIELKPDDPQALNALGYTLVDRTARTEEGRALIEKALKLSPDDPFILDSMGWALFKLGRYDDAVVYLGRAYAGRPDAEIAAHLGEVLWVKGERERAKEIWAAQLKDAPDHPVLLETMRRLSR